MVPDPRITIGFRLEPKLSDSAEDAKLWSHYLTKVQQNFVLNMQVKANKERYTFTSLPGSPSLPRDGGTFIVFSCDNTIMVEMMSKDDYEPPAELNFLVLDAVGIFGDRVVPVNKDPRILPGAAATFQSQSKETQKNLIGGSWSGDKVLNKMRERQMVRYALGREEPWYQETVGGFPGASVADLDGMIHARRHIHPADLRDYYGGYQDPVEAMVEKYCGHHYDDD